MIIVRAACHVHSQWSYDGKWSLEKLAHSFARRGYRILLITEHDQGFDETRRQEHREACRKASTENILLVPGIEYSDRLNTIHLLVWGDVPFVGCGEESEKVLAAAQEFGGVTVFAHPSRKQAWKRFKPEWEDAILGVELWNRKTDGWAPSRDAWPLLQQTRSLPFVSLDFHDSRQFFPLATLLELEESPITEAAILGALRSRRCSPKAFGLQIKCSTKGFGSKALQSLEYSRRVAAFLYRATVSHLRSTTK